MKQRWFDVRDLLMRIDEKSIGKLIGKIHRIVFFEQIIKGKQREKRNNARQPFISKRKSLPFVFLQSILSFEQWSIILHWIRQSKSFSSLNHFTHWKLLVRSFPLSKVSNSFTSSSAIFPLQKEKVKWNNSDREKNKVTLLLCFFSSLLDNANIFLFLLLFSIRIDRWTLQLSHSQTSKDLRHRSCPIASFSPRRSAQNRTTLLTCLSFW